MRGEQQVRTELGVADPARGVPVPPPPVSAASLIARAEATTGRQPGRPARAQRRRLLAAAAATTVLAAVGGYALVAPPPSRPPAEPWPAVVVVPLAYEFVDDPPPAAPYLRALAADLIDAGYDRETGEYAHLRWRVWGESTVIADGHVASGILESELWLGDRAGTNRITTVGLAFPDEASREYFQAHPQPGWANLPRTEAVYEFPLVDDAPGGYVVSNDPKPANPEPLLAQLSGADAVDLMYRVDTLYAWHLVRRAHRAAVLSALAEVPGLVWRGEVTDRAGRPGVAVSYDGPLDGGELGQHVLVFEPRTGELLSHEYVLPLEPRVELYRLYLDAGWTDQPGAEPTGPVTTSPGG
ncbi:MAG TPA: hypothetical protein VIL37_05975 [Natronosporangium sp.]